MKTSPLILIFCAAFCGARLYVGGFPTKDRKACMCFERVERDTPPALSPVTLSWSPEVPEPERTSIEIENSLKKPIFDIWRDAGVKKEDDDE